MNKKLCSCETGWRGWIYIFWKRRLWGQDKKGQRDIPKVCGLSHRTVNFCILSGYYNRHWIKSHQGRWRHVFVSTWTGCRENLCPWWVLRQMTLGWYKILVILSQDRRLVWVSSWRWGGCQAVGRSVQVWSLPIHELHANEVFQC